MSFNGFISYSHAADGRLAPAVQRGLHRLAKPWHRRRALWIFRDQTGLSVTPRLWTSIQRALDDSEYFVLMASPEAAGSPWVNREIEHWVANKPADRILPVVTEGEWRWDPETRDFDESSTAVPQALRGVFAEEPLYLDLRWARGDQHLNLRHSRFRDAIAQLAAPMHGVSKDDLEGEDVRQHRRAGRLRLAAVTSLVVLSGLALLAGMFAAENAAQASAASLEARLQQQEALLQRSSAERFAEEANLQEKLAKEQETRAEEARAEAEKQEKLAREQTGVAEGASAEAAEQLRNADQAAARARSQENLARKQSLLAAQSAAEVRHLEQLAREQQRLTREQERLAAESTAEAQRQQANARAQEKRADEARAEAEKQQLNADQQQRLATSRHLISEAQEMMPTDPPAAMRLGVAAQRIYPHAETRREVAKMVSSTHFTGTVDGAMSTAFGNDDVLAVLTTAGTVALYDAEDRANPRYLTAFGLAGTSWGLTFSADGTMLALIRDSELTLWDTTNPRHVTQLATLPADRLYGSVRFSPDGRTLATGVRRGDDNFITLWDLAAPARPTELADVQFAGWGYANDFAFTPDSRTMVAHYNQVGVFDISDREDPQLRKEFAGAVAIGMSPTAPTLLLSQPTGLVESWNVTDAADPQRMQMVPYTETEATRLTFSRDGKLAAIGDRDGPVGLWSFADDAAVKIGEVEPPGTLISVSFDHDAETVVTTDVARSAVLWNVNDFAAPRQAALATAHADVLKATWQSPDGRSLTTVGADGTAMSWDLGKREPTRLSTAEVHGGNQITSALISRDGRTAVTATWADDIAVTDLSDPAKPKRLDTFDAGLEFFDLQAISPDGRTLILGGSGERQVWDLSNRSKPVKLRNFSTMFAGSGPVAFSPDGQTVAESDGTTYVHLIDMSDRLAPRNVGLLEGHRQLIDRLAFSPDGKTLVTAGRDGVVMLWDVSDRARPHRYTTLATSGSYTSIMFSPDSRTLVLGGRESRVQVWDIALPARPVRLSQLTLGNLQAPIGLAFSPDGNVLTVPSERMSRFTKGSWVGMWDLTELNRMRADPSAYGCAIAGRGLNAGEWKRQIPELPYVPTCD